MPPPKIWLTTVAAMKSGSLRAIPSRPKRIVDCGTSIGVTCRVPAPAKAAGATGVRRAFSGSGPNTSSRWLASAAASIAPTAAILSVVSREGRGAHVNQIGARQRGQGGKIAAHGQAIGMVRIGEGAETPARDKVGIIRLALEAGGDLAHHPLERLRVETRVGDREPQELKGAGRIPREALQASAEDDRGSAENEISIASSSRAR